MFDKSFESTTISSDTLVDHVLNLVNNGPASNDISERKRAMSIVNRLYAGNNINGLKAAGILSEMGILPPVANYRAVPELDIPSYLYSVDESEAQLRERIASAKDEQYRRRDKTTPQEEADYRQKITEGVAAATPEIKAIIAEINAASTLTELDAIVIVEPKETGVI